MRHSEAMPLVDSDSSRALTARGLEQAHTAARLVVERGHKPEVLLVSPLLRAQQTASEVYKETYKVMSTLKQETLEVLSPDGPLEELVDCLEHRGETEIMLVSHQPLVSLLIDYLSGERVGMSTANVALVEMNSWKRRSGDLKWVI